jgi:uncharacterized tellurite resistance protein B-like protein
MFDRFLRPDETRDEGIDHPRAVCALLVAAARADGEFAVGEAQHVARMVADRFSLSPEETAALLTAAAGEERLDLYPVTRWLVDNTDRAERRTIAGLMWQVVLGDGELESREDVLMHRVGKLLQLTHRELIELKLEARR